MWNGVFEFSDTWARYSGPISESGTHAHAALQVAIASHGSVAVEAAQHIYRSNVLLIQPMVNHRVMPGQNSVIFLFVEAQSGLGRALRSRCADVVTEAPEFHPFAHDVAALERRLNVDRLPPLDRRLAAALAALEAGGSSSIRSTATEVGLSPTHLRDLARTQLGVPLARWLLWRKLACAGRAMAQGSPLAQAAFEANFADQAHLTRTMRRMFGITPTSAMNSLREV
jgi:AraC-like DNA-binding protein